MNRVRIFSSWPIRRRRANALAMQAESYALRLSQRLQDRPLGARQDRANTQDQDIITSLESTCSILEHLLSSQEAFSSKSEPDQPHTTETPPDGGTASRPEAPGSLSDASVPEPEIDSQHPKEVHAEPAQEPSTTAIELIRLRDWVLLAKVGGTVVDPAVLGEINKQLGRVLAKEGITPIEESGAYDYNRQSVIGVQPTDDPAQNDLVCSTVRPGYLFHEQLVRPQEVIIYTYEGSASPSAP